MKTPSTRSRRSFPLAHTVALLAGAVVLLGSMSSAYADRPGWRGEDWHDHGHRWHRWHRGDDDEARGRVVILRRTWDPDRRVVIIKEYVPRTRRIIIVRRPAPPPVVVREQVAPRMAYAPAPVAAPSGGRSMVPGMVMGAAGGLLGAQFGEGNGRVAAAAAGAVAGWFLGNSLDH